MSPAEPSSPRRASIDTAIVIVNVYISPPILELGPLLASPAMQTITTAIIKQIPVRSIIAYIHVNKRIAD